jgi:hypothetical protein
MRYPAVGARICFLQENFSREYAIESLAEACSASHGLPRFQKPNSLQKQQELTRAQLYFHQTALESRIFSIPAVTRISSPSFYPAQPLRSANFVIQGGHRISRAVGETSESVWYGLKKKHHRELHQKFSAAPDGV